MIKEHYSGKSINFEGKTSILYNRLLRPDEEKIIIQELNKGLRKADEDLKYEKIHLTLSRLPFFDKETLEGYVKPAYFFDFYGTILSAPLHSRSDELLHKFSQTFQEIVPEIIAENLLLKERKLFCESLNFTENYDFIQKF